MNPELQRNLWLEATPFRFALIAGVVLLVLVAANAAPRALVTVEGAATTLYWFFVVLWGTRNAALSVVGEIRERTWDSQKLSTISPATMMWGKLLGATCANWFGGLLCLPLILWPVWQQSGPFTALGFGIILLALGLFAQAVALLASLVLIRRESGNWRLDTFLCQVAAIAAAFTYYSMWSSIEAFEQAGTKTLVWWGHDFGLTPFHFCSLLVFLFWALVGCWRAMRAELRFANGPWVWLAYLAYQAFYSAGFETWVSARLEETMAGPPSPGLTLAIRLGLASAALLGSAYSMAFLEPKDPVRLRWLGGEIRAGRWGRAFHALDAWMLSYGAAMVFGLLLAGVLAATPGMLGEIRLAALAPMVLALLGFLTRDIAIFVVARRLAGARGDFVALAVLALLYLVVPKALRQFGLEDLQCLFLATPQTAGWAGMAAAWLQGLAAGWLAFAASGRGVRIKP